MSGSHWLALSPLHLRHFTFVIWFIWTKWMTPCVMMSSSSVNKRRHIRLPWYFNCRNWEDRMLQSMLQCNSWQLICIIKNILYSEMLWEINLWIIILVKLKLQNLITTLDLVADCLDYLLIKCRCKFTFVQWFLNNYSLQYLPI